VAASDQLAELTESVTSLREDVKRADDTIAGVGDTFRESRLLQSGAKPDRLK
jgi:hypothetical protein